jgi:hypothetical protein
MDELDIQLLEDEANQRTAKIRDLQVGQVFVMPEVDAHGTPSGPMAHQYFRVTHKNPDTHEIQVEQATRKEFEGR